MSEEREEAKQDELVEPAEPAEDLDVITPISDLSNPKRIIWVVTTAALPWMTGTAVNPLLRALYLTRGRPKGYVTLMIPWLKDEKSRIQLYGKDKAFADSGEQESWIREFCRERAGCREEEKNLRIQFYPSMYQQAFGSIFPLVDICNLIPDAEADVAILEEPEHLNWIRVPGAGVVDESPEELKKHEDPEHRDMRQLGWAHKFRHVVGILHTNYSAYMKDYAMGASLVAAPAITLLSSIVVRAYCHRVIRLSAVLPSLAPNKEVTCNVHGVRSEFLEPAITPKEDILDAPFASVYFIGKVIWAKGFDKVLELQKLYKKVTGNYFAMDIYGGGNDEKAISRALLGRRNKNPDEVKDEVDAKQASEEPTEEDLKALSVFDSHLTLRSMVAEKLELATDQQSIEVTPSESGIAEDATQIDLRHTNPPPEASKRCTSPFEIIRERCSSPFSNIRERCSSPFSNISERSTSPYPQSGENGSNPLSIISGISGKTISTGRAASQAIYKLGDKMVKAGIAMSFTEDIPAEDCESQSDKAIDSKTKKKFFDPPKSRYEFRKHPVPARFLGVKDHALMRDIPEHKIFLNMSTTEVLCTTTAEALAMGKFAIIPKHRKFCRVFCKSWRGCLVTHY